MYAIFKKEIQSFFATPLGYFIVGAFVLLTGLFLWVFKGDFNIFDYGFADLSHFFALSPWVFVFLVPALTMRSLSEERKMGTLELLLIKPLSLRQLALGKFWGAFLLCVIAVLPTIIYVWAIANLGMTKGNYDIGVLLGSYFGLLFLIAAYTSVGLFTSALSEHQITAFVTGVLLCFVIFAGFDAVATLASDAATQQRIQALGAKAHIDSISRGVIDTRDLVYFLSVAIFFIYLTTQRLKYIHTVKRGFFTALLKALVVVVLLNAIAGLWYTRFDLTEDQRFTLSPSAIEVAKKLNTPVAIDVLLGGTLSPEFSKLRTETIQLLKSFASENNAITYKLVNPLEEESSAPQTLAVLRRLGLQPVSVTAQENGKVSQELVFPWATVHYKNRTVKVPLLQNKLGATTQARIDNAVQHLEFAFADAFTRLTLSKKKSIAIIKGNGTLEDIYLADYLTTLREYYNLGAITLDSVAKEPQKVLERLKKFDLALIAKPTEAFSEAEKYVIDQFVINGGKSIWLIDPVAMTLDSLLSGGGSALALPRQLNLKDFFFNYGVRLRPALVNDQYFTQIVLATGTGNNAQYNPVPWYYHPGVFSRNNHPINTNLGTVQYQFASPIDTLPSKYHKTVLLQSSPLSKAEGIPRTISLDLVNQPPEPASYTPGNLPLAVLVQGSFTSMYKNRVKPLSLKGSREEGPANAMLIISDGDVIKNQLQNGRPLELGYDKWTHSFYDNKAFLMKSTHYLLGNTALVTLQNKNVSLPRLDPQKIAADKASWQWITLGVPALLILLSGLGVSYYRKRKFAA